MWLYFRFNLSHRDIEDLLMEKGSDVTHESISLCCIKFGPKYARKLRRRHQGYGDTFFLDEVYVKKQRFVANDRSRQPDINVLLKIIHNRYN